MLSALALTTLFEFLSALVLAVQTALAGKLALECLGLAVFQVDDVVAESLVDGKHQAHNDEQEWQRSHNGDVLQVGPESAPAG